MSAAGEGFVDRPTTLAEYQAIFRRRKWIIIALPLVAAVTAFVLSSRQSPLYQAKAQARIPTRDLVAALNGTSTFSAFGDPTRFLATQANVARDRPLAQLVAEHAGVAGMTADRFLGESSASPQTDVDVLTLSVKDPSRAAALRLANSYADEFKEYSTKLEIDEISKRLVQVEARLKRLRSAGRTASPDYVTLTTEENQLLAGQGLASNTFVQHALGASQVRPLPKRDAILGALLGLALAIGLAFLAEALDKRVRSEQEIEETLGIPLLGRVPRPTRRLRKANKLVMLADPTSVHAQTFRRLRTSLEFVNFERRAKTILLTSALPREGKSTTIANLAVALARAGRRVALADLDLRRPFLHVFFNARSEQGFTDVAVDRVRLDDAMRTLALPGTARPAAEAPPTNGRSPSETQNTTNGRADVSSVLHLLPAGTIPPAADEFLETHGVGTALERLSADFELVLVDTPPLLAVGDVMTLSAKVDAIVVVARLGIHRRQLEELSRQLHTCRAPILGFILTGASHGDSYSYGYGYDARTYEVKEKGERVPEEAEHAGGH